MNQNLELITKKELNINNKIIDILVLNKEKILLLYSDKLEIYKKSLKKSIEILPKSTKTKKVIFIHLKEIKTTNTYNIIAISTNSGFFYFYKITDNSYETIEKIPGNELIKLRSNEFLIFAKKNSNLYSYSLYLIKNLKSSFEIKLSYEKNVSFNSYNEKYKNMEITNESDEELKINLNNDFFNKLPKLDSFTMKNVEFKIDINILKLFQFSNDEIIILIKENNEQKWNYITDLYIDKEINSMAFWSYYGENRSKTLYYAEYIKNHFIFSIILFNYKSGKINYLFNKDILYDFGEWDSYMGHYLKEKETIFWSYDINLIENKFLYLNLSYYNKIFKIFEKQFNNEFIIYNINKNSFVTYDLYFDEFYSNFNYYELIPPKYIFVHKNKNVFYMFFDKTLYELKLKKYDVDIKSIKVFNDNSDGVEFQQLQNNIFYIFTNKTLYKIKLKNNN